MRKILRTASVMLSDHLYSNSLWLIASTFVITAGGFIFWSINANRFTETEVGIAVALLTSMELIVTLSLLGFNLTLVRFMGKSERKEKMMSTFFSASIVTAGLLSLLFILISPKLSLGLVTASQKVGFVLFTASYVIFVLIEPILVSFRRSSLVFIKNVIYTSLKILLVFLGTGQYWIFLSWMISAAAAIVVILPFLPIKPAMKIDLGIIRKYFRFGVANYISNMLGTAPYLVLPLIITALIGAQDTAFFYVVLMMSSLLYVIPIAISSPLISEGSNGDLKKTVRKSMLFVFPIVTLGALILSSAGRWILMIFGTSYSIEGTLSLALISIAAIPGSLLVIHVAECNVKNDLKGIITINAMHALGTIGLGLLFISKGIIGISAGWLVTELIVAGYILVARR